MLNRSISHRRRAATMVECALVYPIVFLFVIGLLVAGLGIFRFQEVASLAREGARYASVHGTKYAQVTGNAPATAKDVYQNAIVPRMVLLDPNQLTYTVTWSPDNQPGSTVTVTLKYNWVPEAYLGNMTLTSTSVVQMSY
jgi:Flp pilus assembly protein TadG